MEQRNVIPIPLCDVFPGNQVGDAIGCLFKFLGNDPALEQVAWNRPPDKVDVRSLQEDADREPFTLSKVGWIEAALVWRKNRLSYLGWEILHRHSLSWLWTNTQYALRDFTPSEMNPLGVIERLFVVRELLWRLSTCLIPIDDRHVDEVIDPLLAEIDSLGQKFPPEKGTFLGPEHVPIAASELQEAHAYVRCQLLRHAREIGDRRRFDALSNLIQLNGTTSLVDLAFVEHQTILFAMGALQSDAARHQLERWNVDQLPAIWTIRRCGLLMELGQVQMAKDHLLKLLDSLPFKRPESTVDYQRCSVEAIALYQIELVNRWGRNDSHLRRVPKTNDVTNDQALSDDLSTFTNLAEDIKERPSKKLISKPNGESESFEEIPDYRLTIRLHELNDIGCNPKELLQHFTDVFKHLRVYLPLPSSEETDCFDIGRITFRHRSPDNEPYADAYRLIRFVEDGGLPLILPGTIQLNTAAMAPFQGAARIVTRRSATEGAGVVFRTRNEKLVKDWLDRTTLATMSDIQVEELADRAIDCLERSLERLRSPGTPRTSNNQWWEREAKIAAVVLGRFVPRLTDEHLKRVAEFVLPLSGKPTIWRLLGLSSELSDLLRRVAMCLPNDDLLQLVPDLLTLPVAGDPDADFASLETQDWVDPISQLDANDASTSDYNFSKQVKPLLTQIRRVTGEHRKNLVLRVVTLWHRGLLDEPTLRRFRGALFKQLDSEGFPANTGCYDSLILALPESGDVDETELYRNAYVISNQNRGRSFWANLTRSVDWERDFGMPRRSVRWTAQDLIDLVSRTAALATSIAGKDGSGNRPNRFVTNLFNDRHHENEKTIREWLHFMGDVVYLSNAFTDEVRVAAESAVKQMNDCGICTVRLAPFRKLQDLIGVSNARETIREAFLKDDDFISWQACSAIVQWGRLATHGRISWLTNIENMIGSSVLFPDEKKIALVLTAARELLEVYPKLDSPQFIADLVDGLKRLFSSTQYPSKSSWSTEKKIRARIECTRLALCLKNMNVEDDILERWLKESKGDSFAEVRRAIP